MNGSQLLSVGGVDVGSISYELGDYLTVTSCGCQMESCIPSLQYIHRFMVAYNCTENYNYLHKSGAALL